jgi:hypothetical protein
LTSQGIRSWLFSYSVFIIYIYIKVNIFGLYVLGGDDIFTILGVGCIIVLTHSILSISQSTQPFQQDLPPLKQSLIDEPQFNELDQITIHDSPTNYGMIEHK